jgi:hypothetical protein
MRVLAAVLVAAVLTPVGAPALAQAQPEWQIEAEEGSCMVLHTSSKPPPGVAPIHGFRWDPSSQVAWMMMAPAPEGAEPGDPMRVKVTTAYGPTFQGEAEHVIEDGLQSYGFSTPDRKDVSLLLSGDLTFTYEGIEGRQVSYPVPLAAQLPRIRNCMSDARAQAKQIAEQGGPSRQASGGSTGREGGGRRSAEPELTSFGSGVFVNNRGHLLTNAHVVEGCSLVGNEQIGPGTVVAVDPSSDLALLQFKTPSRTFASFRTANLRLGESVIAAGFPLSDLLANGLNVTTGNVSALSGIQGDRRFVQITTPIQPGNSGGPLLDSSGRLVGIVSAALKNSSVGEGRTAQNVNYAVAPFIVRAFLQEHDVPFSQARDTRETTEGIAARARGHTVRLECWS